MTRPRENVLMQLLYSNCVPKLTYGAAVKDLTAAEQAEQHQMNVALNNAVRRIFGFRRWESIRQLREYYNHQSIEVMFAKARWRFDASLQEHTNPILRFFSSFTRVSLDPE